MYKLVYTSAFLLFVASGMFAATPHQEQAEQFDSSPAALRQLVQRAVNNDLNSGKHFRNKETYRLKKVTTRGTQVKQVVETKTISVSRLLEINGNHLTPEQQQAEDDRLNRLANSPDDQRKKQKEEKQDDENATKIFKALPDAFIYKYEGTIQGSSGALVHMTFTPDPHWNPPTRELQVLVGMQGTLDIDKQEERIAKIEAHLFRDVDFGWGILGRLYKGGSFTVEQSKIDGQRWETTHMVLDITGKALLFKTLIYKESEFTYDFQPTPREFSVAEGIQFLRSQTDKAQANNQATPQACCDAPK